MKGLLPNEIRELILSVGRQRSKRPLSPIEVAKLMQRALDAGEKRTDIADRLYLEDPSIIGRFIRLLSLPLQVQQLIGWGSDPTTVSFTAAAIIARLKSSQEKIDLAKTVLENQFNKSEIIQIVQIRQRSGNPLESCIKEVLNQRPLTERRHVIIGELQSEKLKDKIRQIPQLERNDLLRSILERTAPGIPSLGATLSERFFLLVGNDRFHSAITSLPSGFEKSITEHLIRELGSED